MSKKKPWKTTNNRFVAFIDILGFKDLVLRTSHSEIYKQLSVFSSTKHFISRLSENEYFMTGKGDSDIAIVNFSDSIALFSKTDDIANFYYFLDATNYLFSRAINSNIPLKGGIAHGLVSLNKTEQIFFGQPIIDAYLIEEEVFYYGIVAHNSIDKYLSTNIKERNQFDQKNSLFEAKTPLKSGKVQHTNLNWFKSAYTSPTKEENVKWITSKLNEFKNTVSGSPRKYVDNTIELFETNIDSILNL